MCLRHLCGKKLRKTKKQRRTKRGKVGKERGEAGMKINGREENLIRASSLVGLSLFHPFLLLSSPRDLTNGSAVVSFHNLIVLIKFRRGIALRWAHWPGGHNANCDVYGMNREWNSKWDDWEGKKAPRSPTGKSSGKISAWKPVFPSLTHILNVEVRIE